jgi:hypothetical protein
MRRRGDNDNERKIGQMVADDNLDHGDTDGD